MVRTLRDLRTTRFENKWTTVHAHWHKWSVGEEMKRPTFGVNRSKREVTEGQHRPNLWAWYLEHLLTDFAAKMEDPFLLQIGTNGPRARGWNGQLSGSGGQRSTSHDAEVRFGGIILDPSSSRFSGFSFYHAVLLQSSVSSVLWQFCLSIYHTEAVCQSYGNSVCPFITPRQWQCVGAMAILFVHLSHRGSVSDR